MRDSTFFLVLAGAAFVAGHVYDSPGASGAAFALAVIGFASLGTNIVKRKRDS